MTFAGFGAGNVKVLGCFNGIVHIDGEGYHTTLYVVPDNYIPHQMLVGNDVLEQADITIDRNGVQLKRIQPLSSLVVGSLTKEVSLEYIVT